MQSSIWNPNPYPGDPGMDYKPKFPVLERPDRVRSDRIDKAGIGGGGGGPGVGGGPGGDYGIRPVDQDRLEGIGAGTSDLIRDYLKNIMSGQDVPYSTDMVTSLRAGAKSAAEGSARSSMDVLGHEFAKTGMARSPASMRQMTDIRRQSMKDYSAASTNIRQNAAVKNYEARMQGLDRAQRWLDNMRRHVLDVVRVGVARDSALAQIQLGYYNIDQQMARLLEDLKFRYAALEQGMTMFVMDSALG